jgi:hypothetical protein
MRASRQIWRDYREPIKYWLLVPIVQAYGKHQWIGIEILGYIIYWREE